MAHLPANPHALPRQLQFQGIARPSATNPNTWITSAVVKETPKCENPACSSNQPNSLCPFTTAASDGAMVCTQCGLQTADMVLSDELGAGQQERDDKMCQDAAALRSKQNAKSNPNRLEAKRLRLEQNLEKEAMQSARRELAVVRRELTTEASKLAQQRLLQELEEDAKKFVKRQLFDALEQDEQTGLATPMNDEDASAALDGIMAGFQETNDAATGESGDDRPAKKARLFGPPSMKYRLQKLTQAILVKGEVVASSTKHPLTSKPMTLADVNRAKVASQALVAGPTTDEEKTSTLPHDISDRVNLAFRAMVAGLRNIEPEDLVLSELEEHWLSEVKRLIRAYRDIRRSGAIQAQTPEIEQYSVNAMILTCHRFYAEPLTWNLMRDIFYLYQWRATEENQVISADAYLAGCRCVAFLETGLREMRETLTTIKDPLTEKIAYIAPPVDSEIERAAKSILRGVIPYPLLQPATVADYESKVDVQITAYKKHVRDMTQASATDELGMRNYSPRVIAAVIVRAAMRDVSWIEIEPGTESRYVKHEFKTPTQRRRQRARSTPKGVDVLYSVSAKRVAEVAGEKQAEIGQCMKLLPKVETEIEFIVPHGPFPVTSFSTPGRRTTAPANCTFSVVPTKSNSPW